MSQSIRILHVDDEPEFGEMTATFLERADSCFSVQTATRVEEGLNSINDQQPDCVVSDYDMPGQDGIDFLQSVRSRWPELPFILFTGKGSEEIASDAISNGATDYLQKKRGTDQYELLANRIENVVSQHRAESRLRETKEEYATVFENALTGLLLVDVEDDGFRYQRCNQRALELMCRERSDVVGNTPCEALGPDNGKKVRGAYRKCIEQGEPVDYTVTLDLPAGQAIRPGKVSPVGTDGEIKQLAVSFYDITDERRHRQQLEQTSARLQALFDHSPDMITVHDDNGNIHEPNARLCEQTGYDAETLVGMKTWELDQTIEPEEAKTLWDEMDVGDSYRLESVLNCRDGSRLPVEIHLRCLSLDSEDQFVAIGRDITERKERERRLTRMKTLLSNMEELADVGAWEYDPEADEVTNTAGINRLYGIDPDADLTLAEAFEFFHPDDRDQLRARFEDCLETGNPYEIDVRVVTTTGEQKWVTARGERVDETDPDSTIRGYVQDITQQKEREQELRAEREFVQQALDALDDLFYVLDTDGTIQRWNEQVPDTTGYDHDELDGLAVVELFPTEDQQTVANGIETTLQGDEMSVQAGLLTKDGEQIPYEFTGARLTDTEGETTGLVGIGRNLTPRKQREQRFRALVENSNDSISVLDSDGRFRYQSPSIRHILGYDPEGPTGELAWEFVHPDDREATRNWFQQITAGEATESIEYRAQHADGSWRWMEAYGNNQLGNSAVEGHVINSRDITARKERERELEALNTQYEALVRNFPGGGVFLLDEDQRFVRAGGEGLGAVGLSESDFLGSTPHELFPSAIADEQAHYLDRTFEGESHTYRQEFRGAHYEIRTMPIRDDAGEIIYAMSVSRDITEQVERKQRLERQNERLDEFAGVVSHDLRNPLQIADGRIELAQAECDSPHLAAAADALDRIRALIDDLLELARGGDTVGSMELVSLSTLAEQCWQVVPKDAATLRVETTQTVSADRSRLGQLLENLLANAVEHGGADVTVELGSLEDGFYIEDDGVGIPEKERDEIFEAGYSTAAEGNGFGLRIVRQIVDAHGWEIQVTDSDSGARFEVIGVDSCE